jgi:hypothetical protein
VYDHTHIASYRHWNSKGVGELRVWLLVLDGRSAKLAGGLPSGPILFGLSRTDTIYLLVKDFLKVSRFKGKVA